MRWRDWSRFSWRDVPRSQPNKGGRQVRVSREMRQRLILNRLLAACFLSVAGPSWAETPSQPARHQQAVRAKAEALGLPIEIDEPAKAVKQGQPKYPREAYSKCLEGTVLVMLVIDSEGSVAEAEVLESQPGLDDAAIKCVKDWRFRPAKKAGQPVGVVGVVPVTFLIGDRLRNKGCPSVSRAVDGDTQRALPDSRAGIPTGTGQNLSGLQFDPEGADFTLWVNRFKDEVYRNWNIPEAANLGQARGHVDFEFTVERDGTLSSLRMEKSSGKSSLDKAAEFAMRGSRLLPLPDDYGPRRITMHVTFHYNDYRAR